MKKLVSLTVGIVIVLTCLSTIHAQDADLRARVEALYQRNSQAIEAKNLDALMSQFTEEFVALGSGLNKKSLREMVEKHLFAEFAQIQVNTVIEQIQPVGSEIQVICRSTMKTKKQNDQEWKTLDDATLMEFLKEENGELKFHVSTKTDKERLNLIQNQTYTDQKLGYSLTMPNGWTIVPGSHPRLQDFLVSRSPDGSSFAVFGYIEIPYNVGVKAAIEGDNAAQTRMLGDSLKTLHMGPTTVGEFEAYESISEITEDGKLNKRWSVYFTTGGLLYTFIFNTISADKFETAKADFESIIKSFSLSAEAKENGVSRDRANRAQGEIVEQIYTNNELGCQVAAPAGWTIESTNIGEMVSVNMKPPKGDSLARFITTNTKGLASLEKIFNGELEGIKAITKDFSSEPIKEITISDHKGMSCVYQFTLEGLGTVKRKSVMFLEKDILFMFACDAIPPAEYDALESGFDQIIQSFTLN